MSGWATCPPELVGHAHFDVGGPSKTAGVRGCT